MLSVTTIVTIALVCLVAVSIAVQAWRKKPGDAETGDERDEGSACDAGDVDDDGLAVLREFGIQSDKHSPGSDVSATRQIIDAVMSAGGQRRK